MPPAGFLVVPDSGGVVLGPGDAFGLAALLGEDAGEVLQASGPVQLLAISGAELWQLAAKLPGLAAGLQPASGSARPVGGVRLPQLG